MACKNSDYRSDAGGGNCVDMCDSTQPPQYWLWMYPSGDDGEDGYQYQYEYDGIYCYFDYYYYDYY